MGLESGGDFGERISELIQEASSQSLAYKSLSEALEADLPNHFGEIARNQILKVAKNFATWQAAEKQWSEFILNFDIFSNSTESTLRAVLDKAVQKPAFRAVLWALKFFPSFCRMPELILLETTFKKQKLQSKPDAAKYDEFPDAGKIIENLIETRINWSIEMEVRDRFIQVARLTHLFRGIAQERMVRFPVYKFPEFLLVFVRDKAQRRYHPRRIWAIPELPQDCCPYKLALRYLVLTKDVQKPNSFLLTNVSLSKPRERLSSDSCNRVFKTLLRRLGLAINVWSGYSSKGAGASWMYEAGLDERMIQTQGRWISPDAMRNFYLKCFVRKNIPRETVTAWLRMQTTGSESLRRAGCNPSVCGLFSTELSEQYSERAAPAASERGREESEGENNTHTLGFPPTRPMDPFLVGDEFSPAEEDLLLSPEESPKAKKFTKRKREMFEDNAILQSKRAMNNARAAVISQRI